MIREPWQARTRFVLSRVMATLRRSPSCRSAHGTVTLGSEHADCKPRRKRATGQSEFPRRAFSRGPRGANCGATSSIGFTISSISRSRSVTPAAIAGLSFSSDLWLPAGSRKARWPEHASRLFQQFPVLACPAHRGAILVRTPEAMNTPMATRKTPSALSTPISSPRKAAPPISVRIGVSAPRAPVSAAPSARTA